MATKKSKGAVSNKPCTARQYNRAKADFDCKLNENHGGPHIDSARGLPWHWPLMPYGMKKNKRSE